MVERYRSVFHPETQKLLEQDAKKKAIEKLAGTRETIVTIRTVGALVKEAIEKGNASRVQQDIARVLIGEHAVPLADKSQFPHVMRELGYNAPDSMVITTDMPTTKRITTVHTYYGKKQVDHVFCKPLNGARQRDLNHFPINDPQLTTYVKSVNEDVLIQEYKPHEKTIRYIRYRDNKWTVYVACFAYAGDEVEEEKKYRIPIIGKRKHATSGESIDEFFTSVAGTYAIPVENDAGQLDNLNQFMGGVIHNLEDKLGGSLPFFSCDIGITDMHALAGEYDEQTMRDNAIFFETQDIPNPWGVQIIGDRTNLKSYINMWKLFSKEHGSQMATRARALRQRKKTTTLQ